MRKSWRLWGSIGLAGLWLAVVAGGGLFLNFNSAAFGSLWQRILSFVFIAFIGISGLVKFGLWIRRRRASETERRITVKNKRLRNSRHQPEKTAGQINLLFGGTYIYLGILFLTLTLTTAAWASLETVVPFAFSSFVFVIMWSYLFYRIAEKRDNRQPPGKPDIATDKNLLSVLSEAGALTGCADCRLEYEPHLDLLGLTKVSRSPLLTLGFVQIALLERSELRAVFATELLKRRLAKKTHHLQRLIQKRFIDKITILIPWSAELNSVFEVYRLTFERYLNRLALKEAGHCGCAEKLLSATAKNRAFAYYRQRFSKIKTDPALRSGSTWLELREAFCNFWEANKEYVETGIRKECGCLDETDLTFGEVSELFGLNQLNVVWSRPENIKLCRQYRISFKVLTQPVPTDSLDAVGLLVELKRYVKAGALYDAEKLADRLLKLAPQNRLALIVKAELALESGESEPNLLRLKSLLESESYPLRLFAFLKSYYRWTGDLKGLEYLSNLEPELTRRQKQASRAGELEIWNRIHPLPPSDPSCSALLAYVKSNPVIDGLWAGRKRVGSIEVTHFRIFCLTGTPETMKSELVEQAQATVELAGGGEFVVDVWPKFLLRVMPRLKNGVIPIGPGSIGRSD